MTCCGFPVNTKGQFPNRFCVDFFRNIWMRFPKISYTLLLLYSSADLPHGNLLRKICSGSSTCGYTLNITTSFTALPPYHSVVITLHTPQSKGQIDIVCCATQCFTILCHSTLSCIPFVQKTKGVGMFSEYGELHNIRKGCRNECNMALTMWMVSHIFVIDLHH